MGVINGGLLDTSKIATCVMLGSLLLFIVPYGFWVQWWKRPVGWGVVVRDGCFTLLVALLVAQSFWPFGIDVANDFLLAEIVLMFAASVGVNISTWVLWQVQRQPAQALTADSVIDAANTLKMQKPQEFEKVRIALNA